MFGKNVFLALKIKREVIRTQALFKKNIRKNSVIYTRFQTATVYTVPT